MTSFRIQKILSIVSVDTKFTMKAYVPKPVLVKKFVMSFCWHYLKRNSIPHVVVETSHSLHRHLSEIMFRFMHTSPLPWAYICIP